MDYKPPMREGDKPKEDPTTMGPADFLRWTKMTGGAQLAP